MSFTEKNVTGLSFVSERTSKVQNAVHVPLKSHPENKVIQTGTSSLTVCFQIFLTISAVVL